MTVGKQQKTVKTGRGRPRKAEVSNSILKAAFQLMSELPYAEVTMERIAERAGVSRPTIYRRWRAKEFVVMDAVTDVLVNIIPQVPQDSDPRDVLKKLISDLVVTLDTGKLSVVIANFVGELPHNKHLQEVVGVAESKRHSVVQQVLQSIIDAGSLGPGRTAAIITDTLLGAIYFRFLISRQPVDETFINDLIDDVLR